jgi:hypothetical protein
MANSPTFHVPADLADDLLAAGLGQRHVRPPAPSGATFTVAEGFATALIVLDVASDLVALIGIRPPLRSLADLIVKWRRRQSRPFSLLAIGKKGQFRLDMDEPPDIEVVEQLLEHLWEE